MLSSPAGFVKKKMCELRADDVTLILEWFADSWPDILKMSSDDDGGERVIISETVDIVLLYTPAHDTENITGEDEYALHIQICRTKLLAVTVDQPIIFKKSAVQSGLVQPLLECILRTDYQRVHSVCQCLEFTGSLAFNGEPTCYKCKTTAQIKDGDDECCAVCLGNEKQRWITFVGCGHEIHARCNTLLCEYSSLVCRCPVCCSISDVF